MSNRKLSRGPDDDLHCPDCGDTGWQQDREGRSLCSCIAETDAGRELAALLATTQAAHDVLAERRRQIEVEGWEPGRDDEYLDESLATAAACYALPQRHHTWIQSPVWTNLNTRLLINRPSLWPSSWRVTFWKPTTRRRDLVKAGALILAEIERLDRAEAKAAIQEPPR